VRALAERYHLLPHQVLQSTPGELYLDLVLTFPPDGPEPAARRPGPDDPSLTALLDKLKQEHAHGAR
jgi:hypothetical protein